MGSKPICVLGLFYHDLFAEIQVYFQSHISIRMWSFLHSTGLSGDLLDPAQLLSYAHAPSLRHYFGDERTSSPPGFPRRPMGAMAFLQTYQSKQIIRTHLPQGKLGSDYIGLCVAYTLDITAQQRCAIHPFDWCLPTLHEPRQLQMRKKYNSSLELLSPLLPPHRLESELFC